MQPKCKAAPKTWAQFLLTTISSAARLRCCLGRTAVPASAVLGAQQLHVSGQPGLKNMARWVPSCFHSSELLGSGSGSCSVPPFLDSDGLRGSSELWGRQVQQQQSGEWLIRALKGDGNREGEVTSVTSSDVCSPFDFQVQPVLWSPGSVGLSAWNRWCVQTKQSLRETQGPPQPHPALQKHPWYTQESRVNPPGCSSCRAQG